MAWYRPTANNINWSTASNWETSSDATISTWGIANALPTVNDYVYLHNRNVILDTNATQSIKAAVISNAALTPGINISPLAKISSSAGGTISCSLSSRTGSNAIIITSSLYASASLFQTFGTQVSNSINISGNLTSIGAGFAINQNVGTSATYNIVGDVMAIGGRSINIAGNTLTSSINIKGNLYVNAAGNCIISNATSTTVLLTITGSVYYLRGGGNISQAAILLQGNRNVTNISGSVYSGMGNFTSTDSPAAIIDKSTTGGSINVIGNVYAGRNAPGIIVTSNAGPTVTVYGNLYNNEINGVQAVVCSKLIVSASSQLNLYTTANQTSSFASGSIPITYPSVNDVRSGVEFGVTPLQTGLMAVPSANDVRYGEPTDTGSGLCFVPVTESVRLSVTSSQTNNVNSTGSVIIPLVSDVLLGAFVNTGSATGSYGTVSDIWNFPSSSLTASGTVGEDIKLSLDTNIGSITGSTLTELNNPNSIYPIAKRLQNIATTSSIIYQFSSSTN
jgi:hypothetical protein